MTKILIVEDNPVINQMYRIKLEANKFKVAIALNGKEALDTMVKFEPDLILLDIMMPVMNGDECLKCIRSNKKFANIPVIILTNLNNDSTIENLEALGVNGYLLKSELTPKQVLEHIAKVLDDDKKQ